MLSIWTKEHDDGDTHSVDATWNHRNERDDRRIKLLKQKWCGRPCAIFWRALNYAKVSVLFRLYMSIYNMIVSIFMSLIFEPLLKYIDCIFKFLEERRKKHK